MSRILIIEDETSIAELERDYLELSDFEVELEEDGLQGLKRALNEDFDLALEILADILQNSTFDNFEKEVFKLKGEIVSDLDSPQIKASDALVDRIYANHYYGNSLVKTLNDVDKIQKQDVVDVLALSLIHI